VDGDGGDTNEYATRVPVQATSADAETTDGANDGADGAVGGGDDSVGVQERTTAEVGAASLKTDNVGELARTSGSSTNNSLLRSVLGERVVGVLGGRC